MKKPKDDWYKNITWNGKIDSSFEDALKRTRGDCNKAEYLQIQGSLLLDNLQPNIQEVGVSLLTRLFEDFPKEHSSVILAREKLGNYYLQQNKYEQAADFFSLVNKYCVEQNTRSGTSLMADLKLAEALFKTNGADSLLKAYDLVIGYPVALLKTNKEKFYFLSLSARICHQLHKKDAAISYAKSALEISNFLKEITAKLKPSKSSKLSESLLQTLEEISIG